MPVISQKPETGEPLFTMGADDEFAPIVVSLWAALVRDRNSHKASEAKACAHAMLRWRIDRDKLQLEGS